MTAEYHGPAGPESLTKDYLTVPDDGAGGTIYFFLFSFSQNCSSYREKIKCLKVMWLYEKILSRFRQYVFLHHLHKMKYTLYSKTQIWCIPTTTNIILSEYKVDK